MITFSIKRSLGFTLIEVLITVLVICVSAIALVRFQNYLSYSDSVNEQTNYAALLAASEMDTLHDFQVLNTQSGYTAYQDIQSSNSTSNGTNATYSITRTVTSNTNPTYKTLSVTVSWTDRYNGAQSIQLINNIAKTASENSAAVK